MNIYYIDGKYVREDEAVVSVNDMVVLRGYGAFDFLRTYGGRPFFLDDHIRRLQNSTGMLGLHFPWSVAEVTDIVLNTLQKNDHDEYNIRIVVTGGVSPDGITPHDNSSLIVMVTDTFQMEPKLYTDGAAIITTRVERYIPEAKSTTYLPAIIALQNARAKGAIESIYVDRHDRLLEGTTSNLFMFVDGKLVTPGDGVLPGVTRKVLLDVLKKAFTVEIRDIHTKELESAEEVFLSSSNKEVMPVVRIDDRVIADGKPGVKTRKAMSLFREYTSAYAAGNVYPIVA